MTEQNLKLSNQALGSVIKGFELAPSEDGLVVLNPPTVRVSSKDEITEKDLLSMVK